MYKTNLAPAAPRKNTAKSRQRHSKKLHAVEEANQQTESDQESYTVPMKATHWACIH